MVLISVISVGSKILRSHNVKRIIQRSVFSCYSTATPQIAENLKAPTLEGAEKEYPERIVKIVDQIAALTLLEVADLNELLSKKLNINVMFPEFIHGKPCQAPIHSMGFMPVQQAAPAKKEEADEVEQAPVKSSYAVKLMKFDAVKKVQLIKEIKNILPDMNLVQAKKFVEAAPGVLKKDLSKEEADNIKKALETCGASVQPNFVEVSPGRFLLDLPPLGKSNHVVVFLTGQAPLPEGYGAGGFLSNERPSAIFKVSGLKPNPLSQVANPFQSFSNFSTGGVLSAQLGISLEPFCELSAQTPALEGSSNPNVVDDKVGFTRFAAENLFNFVSGFAQEAPGISEVYVPLSAIKRWYDSIQRKLSLDPNFWKK
ncbi:hypothetical protein ACTXT7_015967 [Hymenolepis weldensis]